MDYQEAKELLACLPEERTLYSYCHDQYAVDLLRIASRRHRSIQELKGSRYAQLLAKPAISSLMRSCGNGHLDNRVLDTFWQEPGTTYLLTAGLWDARGGRYAQTSRPGANLVLRLNFNLQHDKLFQQSMRPDYPCAFNGWGHPFLRHGERAYFRETLAWARLDIDLATDEVLVEEVQSDWARHINWLQKRVAHYPSDDAQIWSRNYCSTAAQVRNYLAFCEPLIRDWNQAMLAAVVNFIDRELGVSRIWYHTWETGALLKGIDRHWAPPTSLYRQLPKKFCFEETGDMPGFLSGRSMRKKLNRHKLAPRFYQLEL